MSKTIVITGASSGIGANAAERLAKDGWNVAVVGRNPQRTKAVAATVGGTAFLADYDRLDDVRALATDLLATYPTIDVLANNAGGLLAKRGISADGHERTLQHNHLAPFLLTNLLLDRLEKSSARVISTASLANRFSAIRLDDLEWKKRPWFGGWRAYGTSKLETILFIRELAKRTRLEAYSFHPGYVSTAFGADSSLVRLGSFVSGGRLSISADEGATPLVHLAEVAEVDAPNGTYFDGLKPYGSMHPLAKDDALASALWAATSELVGLTR
jgi:NAD(P)-dependent dehydrogenase (short-subunit alcohol dehydrogenase family)